VELEAGKANVSLAVALRVLAILDLVAPALRAVA
jgi:hypothetical protein